MTRPSRAAPNLLLKSRASAPERPRSSRRRSLSSFLRCPKPCFLIGSRTDMNNTLDRLYELLPAIYRLRDADRGYPLRDLLRVVAEQVNVVEDDIHQLYDNWFIETAQDWVVPYIADLV